MSDALSRTGNTLALVWTGSQWFVHSTSKGGRAGGDSTLHSPPPHVQEEYAEQEVTGNSLENDFIHTLAQSDRTLLAGEVGFHVWSAVM